MPSLRSLRGCRSDRDVHRTLREVVADEIREMIRRGDLRPGERLLEDRLAEQLGVSRNPVREAIRALENTGLVEVIPRRGAHVATLDPERAVKLLELRSVLEAFAAQLAAQRRTAEQLEEIRAVLAGIKTAPALAAAVAALVDERDWPAELTTLGAGPDDLSPARFARLRPRAASR